MCGFGGDLLPPKSWRVGARRQIQRTVLVTARSPGERIPHGALYMYLCCMLGGCNTTTVVELHSDSPSCSNVQSFRDCLAFCVGASHHISRRKRNQVCHHDTYTIVDGRRRSQRKGQARERLYLRKSHAKNDTTVRNAFPITSTVVTTTVSAGDICWRPPPLVDLYYCIRHHTQVLYSCCI